MSKKNQLKAGAILSYLQIALNIIIGLAYTPIMIRTLGQSEYGLYNTAASVISVLSLLSLGFNSGYIRYFSRYKKEDNTIAIYKLNGLFLMIFLFLGVISLLCGLFITKHLEVVFGQGLTIKEYEIAKKLLVILTINLSLSFPMSVFSNIISANERFIFLKIMGMLNTVLGPMVMLPLLMLGYRSVTMAMVSFFVSIIVNGIYFIYVVFVLGDKFIFRRISIGLFKDLFIYTVFIALNMVIDQVNWNVDKILLGRFQGTTAISIYSVAFSLHQYYQNFSNAIAGIYTPRIHHICNSRKKDVYESLTELFIKVGRLQFAILMLIISGFVFFGKKFVSFWAGKNYIEAYYVALLLLIPETIALIQNLGIEIQRAENKHQFRSIVYFVIACINFGLSIYLCQVYGPIGSAIGTAVSIVIGPGIIMNIFYYKKCGINIPLFWNNILKMFWGVIPPMAIALIFKDILDSFNLVGLFIEIAVYTIIYFVSMWFISLNSYEKDLVRSIIKVK